MSKCLDCKYYDPQCNECNKDDHYPYVDGDDGVCDKFEKRKECKHRYENCDINGCSIICHRCPSECGCDFYYECKLDGYYCDEKCEIHKYRHEIKNLSEERSKLYTAETAIKLALARYNDEIAELIEKLKKLEKEN